MTATISLEAPFARDDADRRAIWTMLVERDIQAYLAADWSLVSDDFVTSGFFGIDAQFNDDPDQWRPLFESLDAYREEWLRQAAETQIIADPGKAGAALHAATSLDRIEINGDLAIAHKLFHGHLPLAAGGARFLNWRTQYFCRREQGRWKIAGFVGYLAHPRGGRAPFRAAALSQHVTAGPYTPAVETRPGARLIVISGQAPLDLAGRVVGETIEEQSRVTMENCRAQLEAAGSSLGDVFKVTVYLTDLADWQRFNAVYREYMAPPYPARTALQAGLLPGFQVEIEMWATKI